MAAKALDYTLRPFDTQRYSINCVQKQVSGEWKVISFFFSFPKPLFIVVLKHRQKVETKQQTLKDLSIVYPSGKMFTTKDTSSSDNHKTEC